MQLGLILVCFRDRCQYGFEERNEFVAGTTWLPSLNGCGGDGQLTVTQQQFFIGDGTDAKRQWQVPLSSNYAEVPELLTAPQVTLGTYADLRQVMDSRSG